MGAHRRLYAELKVRKDEEVKKQPLHVLSENDVHYRKYTLEEIEAAIDKFSESLMIGEVGYESKLDHTAVAIKFLRSDGVAVAQGKGNSTKRYCGIRFIIVLECHVFHEASQHGPFHILFWDNATPNYNCKVANGLIHHAEKAVADGAFESILDLYVSDWPVEESLSCQNNTEMW
ncbi:hypothetical protein POM88_013387 [Heracleum sosnowskyi]|uniref:RING-type E3 ubiquitin transferase n=1 Tax=Heracleum sosnowskyi TaxID=360622 RepID=A0AAD8J0X8_9APIA|nr:hypothetical protein POM88_013387 [Heracleum sosnowskyi]